MTKIPQNCYNDKKTPTKPLKRQKYPKTSKRTNFFLKIMKMKKNIFIGHFGGFEGI